MLEFRSGEMITHFDVFFQLSGSYALESNTSVRFFLKIFIIFMTLE